MTDKGKRVRIRVKADVGFLNDTVPIQFNKKPVYVCLLAETSDGHLAHFARMRLFQYTINFDMLQLTINQCRQD